MPHAAARVERLALVDFRCFSAVDLELPAGLTVFTGANGEGKTSLLEAVGWSSTARSFRRVPDRALVRSGREMAVLRVDIVEGERRQTLEAEIRAAGRNRVLLNRNPIERARDLNGLLRTTVFAPDDLELVKGGPGMRRDYLDDLLVSLAARYEAARSDYERVLRQRSSLLRSGVRSDEDRLTLDVFDEQLVGAGAEIVRGRLRLLAQIVGPVARAYARLSGQEEEVSTFYEAGWAPLSLESVGPEGVEDLLRSALREVRRQEIERGITLAGPHRDDWCLTISGLDARTQASQGEQRTLALALRLAGHEVSTSVTGAGPVLLLDDVFSELDRSRAEALVENLPTGQTLLTTASAVPGGVAPERRLRVTDGRIEEVG